MTIMLVMMMMMTMTMTTDDDCDSGTDNVGGYYDVYEGGIQDYHYM